LSTSLLRNLSQSSRRSLQKAVDEKKLLNYATEKARKSGKNKASSALSHSMGIAMEMDGSNKSRYGKDPNSGHHRTYLDDDEIAHEIDFVAAQHTSSASARHPSSNLLIRRSMEMQPTKSSLLSARGITHRSYAHFISQILHTTNQIKYSSEGRTVSLGHIYFTRAYAYEICGNAERAFRDYTTCISIFEELKEWCVEAYFNRGLLHYGKGDFQLALEDLNTAIAQDAKSAGEGEGGLNVNLYRNRALLRRKMNKYLESWSDIKVVRKIEGGREKEKAKGEMMKSKMGSIQKDDLGVRASKILRQTKKTLHKVEALPSLSPLEEPVIIDDCLDLCDYKPVQMEPPTMRPVTTPTMSPAMTPTTSPTSRHRTPNTANSLLNKRMKDLLDSRKDLHDDTIMNNSVGLPTYNRPSMNVLLGGSSSNTFGAASSEAIAREEEIKDSVVEILMKEPKDRTKLEARKVANTLINFEFFKLMSDDMEALIHLCMKIEMRTYHKDTYIFHHGDLGDVFYVLYEGAVSITIHLSGDGGNKSTASTSSSKNENIGVHEKTLKLLHKGDTFGETALKTEGGRRGANAKCTQDSYLLVITCPDYLAIEEEHEAFIKQEKLAMVRRCLAFKTYDQDRLEKIVKLMKVKRYDAGTVICGKGDATNKELCLIKKGMVKVTKATPLELCLMQDEDKERMSKTKKKKNQFLKDEPPGIWVIQRNWREIMEPRTAGVSDERREGLTHDFTVGVLGSGQYFGELAVLDNTEHNPVTVIACTNVELYTLGEREIKRLNLHLNHHLKQSLEESIVMHNPPAEKVAHFFRGKVNWELKKGEILETCMSEKWLKAKREIDIANLKLDQSLAKTTNSPKPKKERELKRRTASLITKGKQY